MEKNKLKNVIISPKTTLRSINESNFNFFFPMLILVISGLTAGLNSYIERLITYENIEISHLTFELLPNFIYNYYFSKPSLSNEILRNIVLTFVLWSFMGSLYYIVSKALKGSSTFGSLLNLTAYAYLPLIIGNMVGCITAMFSSLITAAITIIFGIWSFILKIHAVSIVSKFSFNKSLFTVLIPTVVISSITFGIVLFYFLSSFSI